MPKASAPRRTIWREAEAPDCRKKATRAIPGACYEKERAVDSSLPPKRNGLLILPSSFAQAITEPVSEMEPISAPAAVTARMSALGEFRVPKLNRGHRCCRTAAHAVIERDHLRHRGHFDPAAQRAQPPPSAIAATARIRLTRQDAGGRSLPRRRPPEAHCDRDHHSEACHDLMPDSAVTGDDMRFRPKMKRGQRQRARLVQQCAVQTSHFLPSPLDLNMEAFRSVTT